MLTIHRDFGDRTDRKHARLKYVVAGTRRGLDARRNRETRRHSSSSRPGLTSSRRTGDLYGWHKAVDGKWFLTLFVETGRVKDVKAAN